jgi:hypothetical protein
MLYELRRYDVAASKLPALLDRFGSFTVHKWKEYGFRLIGFWTPVFGEKSNQLVYIWAWESVAEREQKLPTWQKDPERVKKFAETEKDGPLVRRVNNVLLEPTSYCQMENGVAYGPDAASRKPYVFELREYDAMPGRHAALVKRFGEFTSDCFGRYGFRQVGFWTPVFGSHNNQFVYMLAWENHEEREQKFRDFRADPERERVFAESEKDGPLVERVVNTMLTPTAFSPVK